MNYHYPSEASFGYTNLRSTTGQAPGYLHPIAYATARFVASANKHYSTDAEVHQVLHQDVSCILGSREASLAHCKTSLHPEYQCRSNKEPDTEDFSVNKAHDLFHICPHKKN